MERKLLSILPLPMFAMFRFAPSGALSLLSMVLLGATSLPAQTILSSNLTDLHGATDPISTTTWAAGRFNTDSTNVTLSSLTFDLGTTSGTVQLLIFSNASSKPGTATDWNFNTTTSSGTITFTPTGGTALSPSTSYWAVLSTTAGTSQ